MKWTRESFLVLLGLLALLIGLFYYGYGYFIEPVRTTAEESTLVVADHDRLLNSYPPTEARQLEIEEAYLETTAFLPGGEAIQDAIVTIQLTANANNVELLGLSRVSDRQSVEGLSDTYAKSSYALEIESSSSQKIRQFLGQLMEEDRLWSILEVSYQQDGNDTVSGTLVLELFYHTSASLE